MDNEVEPARPEVEVLAVDLREAFAAVNNSGLAEIIAELKKTPEGRELLIRLVDGEL